MKYQKIIFGVTSPLKMLLLIITACGYMHLKRKKLTFMEFFDVFILKYFHRVYSFLFYADVIKVYIFSLMHTNLTS